MQRRTGGLESPRFVKENTMGMNLLNILGKVFGSKQDRDMRRLRPIVDQVNGLRERVANLTDTELTAKTDEFRGRLRKGESLDDLLPEAFAVLREATHRVLGERRTVFDPFLKQEIPFMAHFDVQVMGAAVLHQGAIAEMRTGEGKTQVAAMAAYLNALEGKGVHVITVNPYLATRDSEWMGRIFKFLGLTVGCLDATEPSSAERRAAYECDITFGTNNEFGFDYLRDNMASSVESCVQRELNYAIVDEVDNILIDEARTPLIISGPVTKSNREYEEHNPMVARLVRVQDQLVRKTLDEAEQLLGQDGKEYELGLKLLTAQRGSPKNKKLIKLLKEPGVSRYMKTVETDYLRDKRLHEIDEELFFTIDESGHSAEMTEKGRQLVGGDNPDFFVVPDLAETIGAIDRDESLSTEEKVEKREEAHREFSERSERIHSVAQLLIAHSLKERDVDYVVQDGQVLIVDEFTGRILHGRRWSEGLHQAVEAKEGVRVAGENQTLATITFQNFFKIYNKVAGMTGTAITEAGEFHEIYKLDVVTIPTNRPMIRADYDDEIYLTQRDKYNAVVEEITQMHHQGRPVLVGTTSIEKSELISKLLRRTGIEHEVLNAKHHAREASIVSQAGRLGAVTIATNMAGRGTDIVLGGNFEVMVTEELLKEGIDPEDLTLAEKRKRHEKLYKQLQDEHEKVVAAGGLHIVGTERHESRRIDNQLRGRAGRQGDPGSSKFFLSLDDDLMRIFGSGRLGAVMERLGVKEGEVISHPWVSKSIGNAQKRVEGRNFEIRKHLKEYDDVMNLQRTKIYELRQRIVHGENVAEDIKDQIATCIEDIIYRHTDRKTFPESWDLEALYGELMTTCGCTYRIPEEQLGRKTQESLFDDVWAEVKSRYEEKERRFGEELMRHFERSVFLMVMDNLWKDHLYAMDQLKGGVQYSAFGQKNPLYEYQREGRKMYEELMATLAREVVGYLFRLERVEEQEDRMGLSTSRTVHSEFDTYAGGGPAPQSDGGAAPAPRQQQMITNRTDGRARQPVRATKTAGRNEPCPCGSGKKYKKCCGATT
ncbi:MAG: preprotein translocase subunit SecA [Chitinivibrionales bacterium]|nr:preprotein translocase subunit SecA [Chitinivibrionales bacterium]